MLEKQSQKNSLNYLDSLYREKRKLENPDWPLARFLVKYKKSSYWLGGMGPVKNFTSAGSKLYFTQEELSGLRKGNKISRSFVQVDSVAPVKSLEDANRLEKTNSNSFKNYSDLARFKNYISDMFSNQVRNMTLARAWNVSLVGSIILGMFLMSMIYHYLGQGVSAGTQGANSSVQKPSSFVLGISDAKQDMDTQAETDFITQLLKEYGNQGTEKTDQDAMQKKIETMTEGYPIEKMAAKIAPKDKTVAAFLIGIAKKESDWGKHVPVLNGQDCYNYWGYRGIRKRMGTGGHTCFDSPEDAIDTVSKRIGSLIYDEKRNTPGKMVEVWKCGYDCSWDNPKNVRKWVSDVDMYFRKFDNN